MSEEKPVLDVHVPHPTHTWKSSSSTSPHSNFGSRAELTDPIVKADNEAVAAHPDDFAKMADAIDAEDAARDKSTKPATKAPK
jgi:hypothetical protein